MSSTWKVLSLTKRPLNLNVLEKNFLLVSTTTATTRNFSTTSADEDPSATFEISVPFKGHLLEPPEQKINETKSALLRYHRQLYTLRRVEISCDQEYKARNIRGFCHLYDGQEAIAFGLKAALTKEDDYITTYRCHGAALARGVTPLQIFSELFGFEKGIALGKGGSMHLYNKRENFYGGAAIVGAQVPVGTGLAFANKYAFLNNIDLYTGKSKGENKEKDLKDLPVSVAMYGDGSANQGQVWEAANMAALWKLPIIYVCENNLYGMGTSVERSSSNVEYYKQGNLIPGLQVDGMDILAVKQGLKFAKAFAQKSGPIFVEVKTYRYHGHSMSDPGISYRTRDEVSGIRKSRDPIELVKNRLLQNEWSTENELKEIEKELRNDVSEALKEAKDGSELAEKEMFKDVYAKEHAESVKWGDRLESEIVEHVRMPDYHKSLGVM